MGREPSRPCGEAGSSPANEHQGRTPSRRDRTIRRRVDYLRVQQSNVRVTSKHFVWLLACDPSSGPGRVGMTTSRKIGTAVVRNRARRLLREALRALPSFLPPGFDFVVIVRSPLTGLRMQDVLDELRGIERLVHKRANALAAVLREPWGADA